MHIPLLFRIDRFLKESGIAPTLFGRMAVRDPRLVTDLRNGRMPGTALEARVEHFMNMWRASRDRTVPGERA
ncbi:MAG: hypothetical protein RLZZ58_695 [Pseudomonadota bacterium]|jgi:hypothetical protein